MSNKQIVTILKAFQKSPANSKMRREYLIAFEKKMVYRTTKSENPELTLKTVEKVLNKEKSGKFSDFFLHTSDNEKKEILREAAYKANEEQRDIYLKSRLKVKPN